MSKIGLLTKEESKLFSDLIIRSINVKRIAKLILSTSLHTALSITDDKFGDRIPEPWQTNLEELITKAHEAMKDGQLSPEEETSIINKCTEIMNMNIDLPYFNEEDEAVIYLSLWKLAAAALRKAVKARK